MKIIKFRDDTWDFTIHLLSPAPAQKALAYLKKITGQDEPDPGHYEAITFVSVEHIVIAFHEPFKNTPTQIGLLSHELFHAVAGALSLRETKLCDETNEVYAYLTGSLMRRCLERL